MFDNTKGKYFEDQQFIGDLCYGAADISPGWLSGYGLQLVFLRSWDWISAVPRCFSLLGIKTKPIMACSLRVWGRASKFTTSRIIHIPTTTKVVGWKQNMSGLSVTTPKFVELRQDKLIMDTERSLQLQESEILISWNNNFHYDDRHPYVKNCLSTL